MTAIPSAADSVDGRTDRQPATGAARGKAPLVLLTGEGPLSNVAINHLHRAFPGLVVIRERGESRADMHKRRMRRLGPVAVGGQVLAGLAFKLQKGRTQRRIDALTRRYGLDTLPPASRDIPVHTVESVNSEAARRLLADLDPRVVAVYSTRVIGRATLECCAAVFINYHAGINPKYRGQHPAYWAFAKGDDANAGMTIHVVDRGVDTGPVLDQCRLTREADDTIMSLQWRQLAIALPMFERVLEDALAGRLEPRAVDLPSQLWFPPTLWEYVYYGIRRGVW